MHVCCLEWGCLMGCEQETVSRDGLNQLLASVNDARRAHRQDRQHLLVDSCLEKLFRCCERLAVYGSLAPGRENHPRIAQLHGSWLEGYVSGRLRDVGWGTSLGYPGLEWDPRGSEVQVSVLVSKELAQHWVELDEFEGPDYRRILVPVYGEAGLICVANTYALG